MSLKTHESRFSRSINENICENDKHSEGLLCQLDVIFVRDYVMLRMRATFIKS